MEDVGGMVVVVLASVALVVAVVSMATVARLARRSPELNPGGARAAEFERHLLQLAHRLEVVEREIDTQRVGDAGTPPASGTIRTAGVAVSHVGLVRFDAFADTGGGQSFALALIDDDGDGVVLTSLHSRQSTRLYAKGIRRGVADSPLSGEEVQAMRNAGIAPAE